jgi:hypothetical protein
MPLLNSEQFYTVSQNMKGWGEETGDIDSESNNSDFCSEGARFEARPEIFHRFPQ